MQDESTIKKEVESFGDAVISNDSSCNNLATTNPQNPQLKEDKRW